MRKNVFLGLLVILLAFCLTVVGCDNGSTNRNRNDNGNGITTYTVTFNSNGGSNVQSITGITSGSTIILPQDPTRIGYNFSGWFTDNNTFQNQFTSSTPVTSIITVFAKRANDPYYIGTWGGVEFRVENVADKAHAETALEHLKNAAPEQDFIDWIDGKIHTVIVTGVDPLNTSSEPMVNGVVRGRIALNDLENTLGGIIGASIS